MQPLPRDVLVLIFRATMTIRAFAYMPLVCKQWRAEYWLSYREVTGCKSAACRATAARPTAHEYYTRVCSGQLTHSSLNAIKHFATIFIDWSKVTALHALCQQAVVYRNWHALRQICAVYNSTSYRVRASASAIGLSKYHRTLETAARRTVGLCACTSACINGGLPIGLSDNIARAFTAYCLREFLLLLSENRALLHGTAEYESHAAALIIGGWTDKIPSSFNWLRVAIAYHVPAVVVRALQQARPVTTALLYYEITTSIDADVLAEFKQFEPNFANAAALWAACDKKSRLHAYWAPIIDYVEEILLRDFSAIRDQLRAAHRARPDLSAAIHAFGKRIRGYRFGDRQALDTWLIAQAR